MHYFMGDCDFVGCEMSTEHQYMSTEHLHASLTNGHCLISIILVSIITNPTSNWLGY